MKRSDFIKLLAKKHVEFFRHGANHDIYIQRTSRKKIAVPRHAEIENELVKIILKELSDD
jgi:mRNA interferase HicA